MGGGYSIKRVRLAMNPCVIVPVDGSPFSEHALPYALRIALRTGWPIHLVHVHIPLPAMGAVASVQYEEEIEATMRGREEEYLNKLVQRLAALGFTSTKKVTLTADDAAGAVAEYSSGHGGELIVMTTHGRGAFSRFWLGSVADKLLRCSRTPLFMVPGKEGDANLAKDVELKHMIIPLDGSRMSEQILPQALRAADWFESECTLMQVIETGLGMGCPPVFTCNDIGNWPPDRVIKAARNYLEGTASSLRGEGKKVSTKVVQCFQAAAGILEEADKEEADWIALSTHGRKGISRFVLGSVADKLVRGTRVPVFVYRPANH
jgi:nucleotide-binding universal stress UspA family protein